MSDQNDIANARELSDMTLLEERTVDPTWRDWARRALEVRPSRVSVRREEWVDRVTHLRERGLLD